MELFTKLECASCYAKIDVEVEGDSECLLKLKAYKKHGWTTTDGLWYCDKCRPDIFKMDPTRHPAYIDYRDEWDNNPRCRHSCTFDDETYDPYADELQDYAMCRSCDYSSVGIEDDGSTWLMCCVDDPDNHYGHNLYSGHFYGGPIQGRLCPYFRCGKHWIGRDPKKDKAKGIFHVPYNRFYDGD